MKSSLKISIISFTLALIFFLSVGFLVKRIDGTYLVGAIVVSLFFSFVSFLVTTIIQKISLKKIETIDGNISRDSSTLGVVSSSPKKQISWLKLFLLLGVVFVILLFILFFLSFFISGSTRNRFGINTATTDSVTKEAAPKINIVTKSPIKTDTIIGSPTFSKIDFDSSVFIVTSDNGSYYLYRLKGKNSTLIQGLPKTFYSSEFYPTAKGLVFTIWPNKNSRAETYLIKDNKATRISNNYPGELYLDKIFGKGKVQIGLTDNDKEKKIYALKDGELFNSIDIHQIKYPDIVVLDDIQQTNSLAPTAYLVSKSELGNYNLECNYNIFFINIINNKESHLQDVKSESSGIKIDNLCKYSVFDKALWVITRDGDKGLLWKLATDKASLVTDFSLDNAKYYDAHTNEPYDAKITPVIEVFNGLLMINTGRNRYLLDNNKLRHIQNIAFASVSDSGILIAKINNSLYAGCSDASYANFRLCQYDLGQEPIEEKHIGSINKDIIRPYKSVYNDEYYIEGILELTSTSYYHLTDGHLALTDKGVTTILANKFSLNTSDHIDFIKKGEVLRYQHADGYIFDESSMGSDGAGSYHIVYRKDRTTFEGIYYLPN